MLLKGKTALIAGASRNIGKTIALTFAREGADVIPVARQHQDELKQVARECEALGAKALPLTGDLGSFQDVNRMAQQGLDHFGKVDIVVSVAAIRPAQALLGDQLRRVAPGPRRQSALDVLSRQGARACDDETRRRRQLRRPGRHGRGHGAIATARTSSPRKPGSMD